VSSFGDGAFEPGSTRILRALEASFRIGRAFGVEVRILWISLLVPLFGISPFAAAGFSPAAALGMSVFATALLYLVTFTHELGHIVAGRRYGIPGRLMTLSPLGGLAHLGARCPDPRTEMVVTLAGPATHLLWLAVVFPISTLFERVSAPFAHSHAVLWAIWFLEQTNVSLLLFNLLPFYPMDGGRLFRAGLATRLSPPRATLIAAKVGLLGAALFMVAGIAWPGFFGTILLAIGITNGLFCWQEIRLAPFAEGPYDKSGLLDPWEKDPEAWKLGGEPERPPARRHSLFGRVRERLRQRSEDRREEREADLLREVDRILGRLSEVGLGGLTPAERRTLEEASRIQRARRGRK
jgi:Zn-dependent protease